MENDRVAKRSIKECVLVVTQWLKRWINAVKECLKKRCLDVREARTMVHDRRIWQGFVRGECMGCSPGDEPLISTRCQL